MFATIEPHSAQPPSTVPAIPISHSLIPSKQIESIDLSKATFSVAPQPPPASSIAALTAPMQFALEQAKGSFSFSRYEREVTPGDVRTVIIAGESHLKFQSASKAGQELLKAFPVRGLEGATMSQTVCDRIAHLALFPYFLVVRAATKGMTSVMGHGLAGSTIHDAKWIDAVTADPASPETKTPVKTLNLHLEAGELPTTALGEISKLAFAAVGVLPSLLLLKVACSPVPMLAEATTGLYDLAFTYVRPFVDFTIFGGLVASLLPKSVRENFILGPISRVLNIRNEWVLDQRNDLMVKNLLEHVVKGERKEPVLVIVGALHMQGIGERMETAGWKAVEEKKTS